MIDSRPFLKTDHSFTILILLTVSLLALPVTTAAQGFTVRNAYGEAR